MSSEKLMTNGQGISFAQVGRAKNVPSKKVQKRGRDLALVLEAIRDDRSITIGPMPTYIVYPDWVEERLTPDLEVTKVCDPGKVDLWIDPHQTSNSKPSGHQVYEAHRQNDLLKRALSLGHLKFYEENPDQIPAEWKDRGLWVFGWASVVRDALGSCRVPYLFCGVVGPCVDWLILDYGWSGDGPSGLFAS